MSNEPSTADETPGTAPDGAGPAGAGAATPLRAAWPVFLVVLAVALVYAPVARHDFITFDDPAYLTENDHVRGGLTLENIRWAFTAGHAALWHPLTWLSHMLDCELFGMNPGAHHLVSVGFHAANTLLLFLFLYLATRRRWPSILCAALFALHPLRVESVAWAAERKDVLSAFFLLLTLLAWLAYVRRPAWPRHLLALLFFAAGLLSKPMLVTVPFLLLVLDAWPLGRLTRRPREGEEAGAPPAWDFRPVPRLLLEKLPFFALSALLVGFTLYTARQAMPVEGILSLPVRFANAVASFWIYLRQTVWPGGLSLLYPFTPPGTPWATLAGAAAILAVTAALVLLARRHPAPLAGWLWYAGTLVPVIGLIQVGTQSRADRFTYIPHMGLFIAVVWLGALLVERVPALRFPAAVLAAVAVAGLGTLSLVQVRYWKDSETLYRRSLEAAPGSHLLNVNLGNVYLEQERFAEAFDQYAQALRVNPRNAYALANLGRLRLREGKPAEALPWLDQALAEDPGLPIANSQKGVALCLLGDLRGAAVFLGKALRSQPRDPDTLCNLAAVRARQGRGDEARDLYRRALDVDPDRAPAHASLGTLLLSAGDTPGGLAHLETAVRLEPRNADTRFALGQAFLLTGRLPEAAAELRAGLGLDPAEAKAWYNLGLILHAGGDAAGAAAALEAATRLDPGNAAAQNALGVVCLVQGRDREAESRFREALRLDPAHVKARLNLEALRRRGPSR
ncbi:MAG: tetratricopeptide repeat protein [Acidobacteria bacterium]|nr:tetratricopeptide repeat protein [Acidobacteriota bacterium]